MTVQQHLPYTIRFIGASKEIPKEQHYQLTTSVDGLIIYASSEREAIKAYFDEVAKLSTSLKASAN